MSKGKLKFISLLLSWVAVISACQGPKAYFQSGWVTYTNVNKITDISFSPDGFLWASTIGGVVKWDIANKTYIKYSIENGLPSNDISTILADAKGTIWIGSQQGEIASFDGGKWFVYEIPELGPGIKVNDIYEDSEGRIWFATYGAGAIMYNGKVWKTYLQDDGLMSVASQSIGEFPKGKIWVATWVPQCECLSSKNIQKRLEPGWSIFDEDEWNTIYTEAGLETNAFGGIVSSFATDKNGLWISITDGADLLFYDGNAFKKQDVIDSIGIILDLKFDQIGNLWGASDTGVFTYDGTSWEIYTTEDGLLNSEVSSLGIAPDGSLWFGTKEGISYFNGKKWGSLIATNPKDSIPLTWSISDVAFAPEGDIWLATYDGVLYFDGEKWKRFTTKEGLPDNDIRNIDIASDGTVWVSSLHNITDTVSSFDGAKWTVHDYGDFTQFIDFDHDGKFWTWSYNDSKVRYFDGADWKLFPVSSIEYPKKVLIAPDSSIWIQEFSYGVWRFDGQRWIDLTSNKWITGLAMSPDGSIWIARSDSTNENLKVGFYKFVDGVWSHQTDIDGATFVKEMVFADDETLWIILDNPGEVWRFHDAKWTEFGLPKGLLASSIYFSPDDSIWFATNIGLTRYSEK